MANRYESVDEYILSFPPEVQPILEKVRQAIRKGTPGAEETISYQIPTFKLDGKSLVYFGGWKHHVGIYPIPKGDPELEKELAGYRAAKDTLRFPLGEPIPYELIERVAVFLVNNRQDKE